MLQKDFLENQNKNLSICFQNSKLYSKFENDNKIIYSGLCFTCPVTCVSYQPWSESLKTSSVDTVNKVKDDW